MGLFQRIITAVLPRTKAAELEKESRAWIVTCDDCETKRSVWELGGIRWKASGSPRWRIGCETCGAKRWHTLSYVE